MKSAMRFAGLALAVAGVLAGASSRAEAGQILVSGGSIDSNVQGYLATRGLPSTYVDPNSFSSTSLSGYTGVWLGWITTYPGLAGDSTNLLNFMNAGGNVLIGPLTNYQDLTFMSGVSSTFGSGDSVHIVDPSNPVMSGLTDAGLSGWSFSYHDTYSADASWTVLSVGVDSGNAAVTIEKSFGLGHLILTGQDSDFHSQNGAGDTGPYSQKISLVVNALNPSPFTATPEPSTLVSAGIAGLFGLGYAWRRRKAKPAV
jgi:hypothetical protein